MNPYQRILDTYPDTVIAFGEDGLLSFELLMQEQRAKKIAAFTGKHSADATGAWARFLKTCGTMDVGVVRFSDIEAEPCINTVERMIEFLHAEQPDVVVAIGGGSPMDAAKAAYLVYQCGGTLQDYFGVNKFSSANPGKKLKKVICFPTTSGTGSEATPYANIVDNAVRVKKLISEVEIIPEYSFVVPELAASMPQSVTLATGCDALAHSLEGFLNIGQDMNHPKANEWALESIRLIVENLPKVVADGSDVAARTAVSAAATLGGMVIRYKSTGLPHLCSFSWFGRIEHGIAVAMLLPAAWGYYIQSEGVRVRTMELKGIFPGDTPEEVVNSYRKFLDSLGVPEGLEEFSDITPELLEVTAESAGQNKMKLDLAPKPVPLENSKEILAGILEKAYYGK
jgi:alcohol dehydrogenase